MLIHSKKNSLLIFAVLLPVCAAMAQDAPPSAQSIVPAANPAPLTPPPANPSATGLDGATSSALDYLYNHQAQEGTGAKATQDLAGALADKIKAIDVLKTPGMDDPEVRARFETYLSLKEVPDARVQEYFGKVQQVSDLLKAGQIVDAWKLLYSLSTYKDLDAGISSEVAHRVESVWNTDRTKDGLELANTQLKSDVETANHNADLDADDIADQQALANVKAGKNNGGGGNSGVSNQNATNSPLLSANADPVAAEAALLPTMSGALKGQMDLTSEYINMLGARAQIKLNQFKENQMSDQVRMDFADYIRSLYTRHRYYHVIIAADFYRALFNEGDYPSDISNQATTAAGNNGRMAANSASQIINTLGIKPGGATGALNQATSMLGADGQPQEGAQPLSIADEVTSALEMNNEVSQAIEVFRYRADKGDVAAAADQLQEAFVGNEYHPGLQGLPRAEKEKVGDFLDKLDKLKNELEVRDFEEAEGQIADIQKVAADFDPTKPMALVNDTKMASQMQLGTAKLLAQGGHLAEAIEEFKKAGEVWPGNPDLKTSASTFFDTEDLANQSTTEFDRLIEDQNYRAIFDKQVAFAPAIKGDAKREQELKDALEKVGKAKMAEEKANMLVMNGDVDGAWETVELATQDWPDDMQLNRLLANLSGRSADFVSALDKARDAEAKKELGYSLTWYVNAQTYYPASIIANEGIDRVKNLILAPASSSSDSTPSSAQ